MHTSQTNMITRLRGVQEFLDENETVLGGISRNGTRRQLDQALSELVSVTRRQSASPGDQKSGSVRLNELRSALVNDHMAVIATIAAVSVPGAAALTGLRMPGRMTAEKLVAAGGAMAEQAEPHAAVFIAAGMPEDFIAQLLAATDELAAFLGARKHLRGKNTAATKAIQRNISAGNRVEAVLDKMIRRVLKNDPARLDAWASVRRVRKTARRPAEEVVPIPAADGVVTTPVVSTPVVSITPVVPIAPAVAKSA